MLTTDSISFKLPNGNIYHEVCARGMKVFVEVFKADGTFEGIAIRRRDHEFPSDWTEWLLVKAAFSEVIDMYAFAFSLSYPSEKTDQAFPIEPYDKDPLADSFHGAEPV